MNGIQGISQDKDFLIVKMAIKNPKNEEVSLETKRSEDGQGNPVLFFEAGTYKEATLFLTIKTDIGRNNTGCSHYL